MPTYTTADGVEVKEGDTVWRPLYYGREVWTARAEALLIDARMEGWYIKSYCYSSRDAAYREASRQVMASLHAEIQLTAQPSEN